MDAVMGRVAHVNLSNQKVDIETVPDDTFRKLLGGNGLAAKIMLERVDPGTDPFSPENILVLATGPLAGTAIQGSDRLCVAAKSPLTGLFFDSNMGGRFASTLKATGYDALVVTGKADTPAYVFVDRNSVEIRDAAQLKRKSCSEVMTTLSSKMDDFEVCTIGIAGENLVKYASVVHPRLTGRHGVAGRGGLGAVMGAKNLKAVVAKRSEREELKVHSERLLKDARMSIQANLNSDPRIKNLTVLGTSAGVLKNNQLGCLGTRNLTDEVFEHAENISGERLSDHYYRKNIGCHSCPVVCGKLCALGDELLKHPEYETLYALGSMVGVDDLDTIITANKLCDEYGLDTITMGVSSAFAMECFERGIISRSEAGGHELRFGDGNLLLTLIEETARREGIGNLLAEGTRRMSEVLGGESWKYAYQVKGLELPAHSPRAWKVMSIGYATGTRGGSHQDTRKRSGPDMSNYEGKVELAIPTQHLSAMGDSLIQCRFVMESGCGADLNDFYPTLIEAVTGWRPDVAELDEIGERICNMERLFNVREGISRKDDILPYRVMEEGIPSGPLAGQRTPREKLAELLDRYYQLRGWDDNGIPRKDTLERLGLTEYHNA